MKIRTDFVSNSSSSSFMYTIRETNLMDELMNLRGLMSNMDLIWFDWDLHDDAKEAYQKLMESEAVKKAQEEHDYDLIRYEGDPNKIEIVPMVFNIKGCFKPIMDAMKTADTVEFFISESWDSRVTRLIQLLTVLDTKGYIPQCLEDDHVDYVSLKEIENENQN